MQMRYIAWARYGAKADSYGADGIFFCSDAFCDPNASVATAGATRRTHARLGKGPALPRFCEQSASSESGTAIVCFWTNDYPIANK